MSENLKNIPKGRWFRILPPIMIVCIISYMDRVNIGFAMAGGMDLELAMTASLMGLAAGIFFIGYLFLQIPAGQIAANSSGKKFITCSLVAWAVISVLSGLVQNSTQLIILRFLLGVAEGGMLPVVLTMVGNWFPNEERGRANAIVILFVPIAAIITGPLSGFVISLADWRMLFIVEGLISLLVVIPWMFVSNRPSEAKWLTAEEKNYIDSKLSEEKKVQEQQNIKQAKLVDILPNITMWKLISLNFCYQCGIYGFGMWLPVLIKHLTNTNINQIGWLSIFPYIGCAIGMLTISNLSDKSGKRKIYVILPLVGFALCLLLSVKLQENIWLSYAFLVGCGFFLQAAAGVFWTIPPKIFSPQVAGGARGLINALGNLGGFVGPYLVGFLIQAYSYDVGVYALVSLLFLGAIITTTLPKSIEGK